MRIKKITGEVVELDVDVNQFTMQDLQEEVADRFGIAVGRQQLEFQGKSMKTGGNPTLAQFGISSTDEVMISGQLKGGCSAGANLCGAGAGCRCNIM